VGSSIAVIGDKVAHFLQLIGTSWLRLFRFAKVKCCVSIVHVTEIQVLHVEIGGVGMRGIKDVDGENG
jgi:hypothetical protein